MRSPACRQVLVAAMVGWMVLTVMPSPARSAQGDWIEQIAQQIREQKKLTTDPAAASAYDRYLAQLQRARQAFVQNKERLVQREMGRLVAMVGAVEDKVDDASARLLLTSIERITPAEYLDSGTRNRLRLVKETDIASAVVEEPPEPSPDALYSAPAQVRQEDSWTFGWMGNGKFHPLMGLGAGFLLMVGVGVVVMVLVASGVGASRSRKSAPTQQASGHANEDEHAKPAGLKGS